jgi:hypothetical protein
MIAHEGAPAHWHQRIPLDTVNKVVAVRLGQTRANGNAQPAVFNRKSRCTLPIPRRDGSQLGSEHFITGGTIPRSAVPSKKIEILRNSEPDADDLLVGSESEIIAKAHDGGPRHRKSSIRAIRREARHR